MSTEREMTEAAARAMGLRVDWEELHGCYWLVSELGMPVKPWQPRFANDENFALAAALRISVEHNHPDEKRPWVCASVSTNIGRTQQFMEDVPTEELRADRMRLAILRCAAAQAHKEGV